MMVVMITQEAFDAFVQEIRAAIFALRAVSEELHADFGCSPVERGVLEELRRLGPTPVPALARSRAVSRQAMQKTIDRMIARGWVMTASNPNHRRSPLITLTESGTALDRTLRDREATLLSLTDLPIDDAELQRTTETLARFRAAAAALPQAGGRR
jgi:DNA-binding MarR family transcriptional regulator